MEFLIWGKYQSRAERLSNHINCNIHYIHSEKTLLVRYLISLVESFRIIIKAKRKEFIFQLPPNLIVYIFPIIKLLWRESYIVLDMHNGATRGAWGKLPFVWTIINKYSDLTLVHNEDYLDELIKIGLITSNKIEVLPDPPADNQVEELLINDHEFIRENKINILIPCSYNPDEPLMEIINLADLNKEFNIMLTGNKNKALKILAGVTIPKNITFTGFVSAEEYKFLFLNSDVVMGLTNNENIQLSVSTESLSLNKPAILSNTQTLKKIYPKGYLFTDNNATDMAKTIYKYLANYAELLKDNSTIREEKIYSWNGKLESIKAVYRL